MTYEHKIVDTFCPFWKRTDNNKHMSLEDISAKQLNDLSIEGWEVVSACSEFKFVLRRPSITN